MGWSSTAKWPSRGSEDGPFRSDGLIAETKRFRPVRAGGSGYFKPTRIALSERCLFAEVQNEIRMVERHRVSGFATHRGFVWIAITDAEFLLVPARSTKRFQKALGQPSEASNTEPAGAIWILLGLLAMAGGVAWRIFADTQGLGSAIAQLLLCLSLPIALLFQPRWSSYSRWGVLSYRGILRGDPLAIPRSEIRSITQQAEVDRVNVPIYLVKTKQGQTVLGLGTRKDLLDPSLETLGEKAAKVLDVPFTPSFSPRPDPPSNVHRDIHTDIHR